MEQMNYLNKLIKEENEINPLDLNLPATSALQFVDLERDINESPIKKSIFMNELQKINGTTLEIYVRECLQKTITSKAARKLAFFDWHKCGRTIAVEKYTIIQILLDAALNKFPNSIKYDVIPIFVKWFEFAADSSKTK